MIRDVLPIFEILGNRLESHGRLSALFMREEGEKDNSSGAEHGKYALQCVTPSF